MYTREEIKNELYQKYIRPTERVKKEFIGIEVEMPIAKLDGTATDYQAAQAAFSTAIDHFNLTPEKYDDDGVCFSATDSKTGDNFSFDCAYNNLELSLGRADDLHVIDERFKQYVRFFNAELEKTGHLLTGMGINPNYQVNRKDFIPANRYQMLERYLQKSKSWKVPMYFHPYSAFGAFASASQVQLDVNRNELLQVLHGFSLVEPVKAVLFSNSVMEEEPDFLCVRDLFWENSTHGINPHNIGAFDCKLESLDDLLEYISTTSIFCAERDGHYMHFRPIPIAEYLALDQVEGEYYQDGSFHTMTFTPKLSDLVYLRTYKFEDLTFRGTVEFRSVCCQPLKETMTVSAFHMGLMKRLPELITLMQEDHVLYHHGYSCAELRRSMNGRNLPQFVDREELKKLCFKVLYLAEDGMKSRGKGEEIFLKPLFERAETLTSPARIFVEGKEANVPLEALIRRFSL